MEGVKGVENLKQQRRSKSFIFHLVMQREEHCQWGVTPMPAAALPSDPGRMGPVFDSLGSS